MQVLRRERRSGVVLAMVLILGLLLSTAVVSFISRSMIDGMISRNRDRAANAEALARGGIQVAIGLILEDALADAERTEERTEDALSGTGDTLDDLWARISETELVTPDGGVLKLEIRDAGSRLNLNALVDYRDDGSGQGDQTDAENFLTDLLEKIIDELNISPDERRYEPRELGQNLIDYIDSDEIRVGGGGSEDDYYQRQTPPYRAANRPFLSIEELALVEGFDEPLVAALAPYVTVYPPVKAQGININTAPPHVLSLIYYGTETDRQFLDDDDVQRILNFREDEYIFCDETELDGRCVSLSEVLKDGSIYPPVRLPSSSSVFMVTSEAKVGELYRILDAVIDVGEAKNPRVLAWRYR